MRKIVYLLATVCCLAACNSNIVYSRFASISSREWHADSVISFDYNITDTAAPYSLLLYVRHTERYPYQNMWVFISDGTRRDTVEFYLADDRGRWLGDKQHGFIEMPVLLEEHHHFPDTGTYHLTVQQGMRDSLLRGITDVGIELVRDGKE